MSKWHISRRFVPPEGGALKKVQELSERDRRSTIMEAIGMLLKETGELFNIEDAVRKGEIPSYAPGSLKPLGVPEKNLVAVLDEEEVRADDLNAWLDKYPSVEFRFPSAKITKAGRKPGKHRVHMKWILTELESWAKNKGREFNPQAMPGQVGTGPDNEGGFHWFCAKLFPYDFRKQKGTFEKHRAGLCTFPPYPKPSNFYKDALPSIAQKLKKPTSHKSSLKKRRKAS